MKEKNKKKENKIESKEEVKIDSFYAKIVSIVGRTGKAGEVTQTKCILLNNNKEIVRNFIGPIYKGEIVLLYDINKEYRLIK